MEDVFIECKTCQTLAPEMMEYSGRLCKLCNVAHCDECLNEAGYCTPCSEKLDYLKEDAIAV
jgi:hypothetical protein